jgi:hypothetical protein
MRINPNGKIGDSPALAVRKMLRYLRGWDQWKAADLETVAALAPGTGDGLVKVLQTEGLIEAAGKGVWAVTQAGRTFSAATAAKPVTRATAEKALAEFFPNGCVRIPESQSTNRRMANRAGNTRGRLRTVAIVS